VSPAVVGNGASAGSLEALKNFFRKIHADTGLDFVVIQHLSPRYKIPMGQVPAGSTGLNVIELQKTAAVQPNCIYLKPGGQVRRL